MPRKNPVPALVATLALGVLALPGAAIAAVTFSGTISSDTTWTRSPDPIVHVTGQVTISPGVKLTIEPGVTVKFNLHHGINVYGELHAVGGAAVDSTIWFTSIRDDNLPAPGGDDTNGDGNATIPASGDIDPIWFRPGSSGASLMKHCEVWFGGYYQRGAVICETAAPTLEDCQINAGYYGIECINAATPTLRDTDVSACTSVPVAISVDSNPVFDAVTFASTSDNGFDAIGILGTTLTAGANVIPTRGTTLAGTPIDNLTYMLLADITINPGATLTIDPGVVMKPLNSSTDILVNGTLIAMGTSNPDSQIVFTSFKDDNYGDPADTNNDGSTTAPISGDWGGINFSATGAGTLDWCTVKYGGYGSYNSNIRMENVAAAVSVTNCDISDAVRGIEIAGVSTPPITGNTISNSGETPILMSVSANPTFAGNVFSGNGITALGLINETVGVDSQIFKRNVAGYVNITYVLDGDLSMSGGTVLTVDPGVVLKLRDYYTAININGGIQAVGAVADSVVFTSWKDDTHGNPADTNSDGSASAPAHSDWSWIRMTPTAIDSLCNFQYCFLGYGGMRPSQAWQGTLWCESSSPDIRNCNFWTDRIGVRCDGNSAAVIEDNEFFNSYSVPIHVSALANPTIQNNYYDQNGYHALGLISETLASSGTLEVPTAGAAQFGDPFPYFLVRGAVAVGNGSTLTVEPGVVIKHNSYGWIVIGGFRAEDLSGTNPIVFTDIKDDGHGGDSNVDGNATNPSNGDWPNIQFNDLSDDANCVIDGCEFWYGGWSPAVISMTNASPTIRNSSFEFNYKGIWAQGLSNPTITNNLIRQCTWTPLVLDILANPTLAGNTLDSNGLMGIGYMGGTLAQDGTIPQRNFAGYTNITAMLNTNLTVAFGVTLTIDPGVVLKLWDGGSPYYTVGRTLIINGALVMDGTPVDPITVTSVEDDTVGNPADTNNDGALRAPGPGEWGYIRYSDVSNDAVSIIDNCILRYGGDGSTGLIRIQTSGPTISNNTIESTQADAIRLEGTADPAITGNTITDSGRTPIAMSLLSTPTLSGNTISGNFYEALGILGETLAQDVTWIRRDFAGDVNREYVLLSTLTVGTGANLTLEKGLVIKPLNAVDINVRRGLFAQGGAEPESLIVFTSPYDDFYGGDTNGDSTDTNGWNLRWGTIEIEPTALNANVVFENCVFAYAGTSTAEGAITVQGTLSPDIDSCIFSHLTNGINYTEASGDSTKGKVTDCDFFDHTAFAIKNTGLAHTVSARNCWWGDDTGPTHASNPGGLGDEITDLVAYTPWQGMGLGNYHMGDVSLNGEVRAYDASLVLQHLVAPFLTPQQQVIGDVSCAAGLTAFDASQILQWVAQLIVTFDCLQIDDGGPKSVAYGGDDHGGGAGGHIVRAPLDYVVSLEDVPLRSGERIRIPLVAEGTGDFSAAQFTLRPDAGALRIVGLEAGPALGEAEFHAAIDDEGVARIAAAGLQPMTAGALAIVTVEVAATPDLSGELAIEFLDAMLNEQDVRDTAQGAQGLASDGTSVDSRLPDAFALAQNRPNPVPVGAGTAIHFSIPQSADAAWADLSVFGVDGRRIRTLVSGAKVAGSHDVQWDGRDDHGQRVAAGVYFYRLSAGSFVAQKKLVLLK